jgi:KipI family sensor histidine kinase inhibitor
VSQASDPTALTPRLRTVGLTGLLVSFADRLSEPANRAALALRAALEAAGWDGVEETSTALTSVFLRFDPLAVAPETLAARVSVLLDTRDWAAAPLPEGRRLWSVPTVYGTDLAPQLNEAAAAAGLEPSEAVDRLAASRVRVLTIGFAPGQPYLGPLATEWDIPRQTALTGQVPAGALVLAIRQFVLFTAPNPTGWRHVGQTAFRCYRPEAEDPFALRPGDEMRFVPVTPAALDRIRATDPTGNGGASCEAIG